MILDTRDLEVEIVDLECEEDDAAGAGAEPMSDEDAARLECLRELRDEIGSPWFDGVSLIPEDEFEDYAREFARDIGVIEDDCRWPCSCIDWSQAAMELQTDYTSAEWDGETHYWRE